MRSRAKAQTARADAAVRQADRAGDVARDVGAKRTAGVWYDAKRGAMVVNVTTAAAAREVRQDGLTARRVEHSTAALNDGHPQARRQGVDGRHRLGGRPGRPTRWSISLDSTVGKKATARITKLAGTFGDKATRGADRGHAQHHRLRR